MKHELYKELTKPEFKRGRDYYTDDLGEEMSIVHESICGWWKSRFLLDNKTQEAFEFLDMNEHFVKFSEDDVEWSTLRDVPGDARGDAPRPATPPIPHMYASSRTASPKSGGKSIRTGGISWMRTATA